MPFFLFLCLLAIAGPADIEKYTKNACSAGRPVSMIALLANPEQFNGSNISTYGYIVMEEEIFALCPYPTMSFLLDCLRVHLADGWSGEGEFPSGGAVYVEGKFSKPEHENYIYGGVVEIMQVKIVNDFSADP